MLMKSNSIYTHILTENQPDVNPDIAFSLQVDNEWSKSEDPEEKRILEASELFWGKLWTEIPTFHLESPEDLLGYKIDFCLSLIREKQEKAVNTALSLKEAKQNTVMLLWAQRKLAEIKGGAL
jgi:hypothetical protein